MNPPAALQGAMGRERKPFTYTPGGLDLSEIKSERMAKRLMRNAMNQGVPERPPQLQSPPTPSAAIVPNFNCLPVQVFPSFQLPANPKSLLRTRSTPAEHRQPPSTRAAPSTPTTPLKSSGIEHLREANNNKTPTTQQVNNCNLKDGRPASVYENTEKSIQTRSTTDFKSSGIEHLCEANNNKPKTQQVNNSNLNNARPASIYENTIQMRSTTDDRSNSNTEPILPEISYDAEYFEVRPRVDLNYKLVDFTTHREDNNKHVDFTTPRVDNNKHVDFTTPRVDNKKHFDFTTPRVDDNKDVDFTTPFVDVNKIHVDITTSRLDDNKTVDLTTPRWDLNKKHVDYTTPIKETNDVLMNIKASLEASPLTASTTTKDSSDVILNKPVKAGQHGPTVEDEKRGVRIVKKKKVESQSQKEQKVENGDADAELTVQLPSKKSSAKTETKVEVSKKTLPDGSTEEIKTTTTRTTIDGRTEIKTRTEKTIIPKQQEVEEVEEEEEEETGDIVVQEIDEKEDEDFTPAVSEDKTISGKQVETTSNIIQNEERSESTRTTTKRVVVVQDTDNQIEIEEEDDEEEEEVEEVEGPVVKVERQTEETQISKCVEGNESEVLACEEFEEDVEEEKEEVEVSQKVETETRLEKSNEEKPAEEEEEEVEEEEEYEEAEADEQPEPEVKKEIPQEQMSTAKKDKEEEESEYTEEEYESEEEEPPKPEPESEQEQSKINPEIEKPKNEEENKEQKEEKEEPKEIIPQKEETKQDDRSENLPKVQIPLREPSIPLDKVEEVEIKPIGGASETIKTVRESTEIIKGPSDSSGVHSTHEYNRIENIVTVNRTTKTLDNTYEQLTQQGIPTQKTYFAPEREKVSTSPQPLRAYEPTYPTQPEPERRHSLLLDRLSTERQMPSELYQNHCINREQQRQWSQEPQSEVVNDSNVKPSSIKNTQWYQQTKKENVTYNNVTSTQSTPAQQWNPPPVQPTVPSQPLYQQPQLAPQPQLIPQPQLVPQPPPQTLYQQPPAPMYNQTQHQFQQPQPQYQQHQSSYTDKSTHISSDTYKPNSYPTYTPKPSNWTSDNLGSAAPYLETQLSENTSSYLNKNSSETYNKSSHQYLSSYVPPPWEQDPSYVAPELHTQSNYQPATSFTPNSNPAWQSKPAGKFPKPAPKAYIPPAPNQSFVKPVNTAAEPPKVAGRKTYYSEYERRYISVPEATYVPGDNKLQPDPSPQYYYDNTDPKETAEPEWRKELREFTEKSSQTQSEQTSVRPPWETDNTKYTKTPAPAPFTPTPSWSQTLRPQSWRERSFESEFVGSNEFTKTNTVGRGRPLSTYGNPGVETIPERPARGVSVDRYNPNNYQSPIASEHAPVPTHTLNPPVHPHAKGHHPQPHVPGYHARAARASAEPRDHAVPAQHSRGAINWGDQRHSPIQSRSFKYLQWITGTDE